MADSLRQHLDEMDRDLAVCANRLWIVSKEIHDRQNRPDSNEDGREHVEMVEHNIWRLLNETTTDHNDPNLRRFNPKEIFLLSCSACCHDFDKAVESALPEGFVHAEGSADLVVKNAESLGLDTHEARAVASIIRLHDLKAKDFQKHVESLDRRHAAPRCTLNLQLLAVLVKAADVLHTDFSRIPTHSPDASRHAGLDRKKYLARQSILGWRPDGTRIQIQAEPQDPETAAALIDCFTYMKTKEWPAVGHYLELDQFPFVLELKNKGVQPPSRPVPEERTPEQVKPGGLKSMYPYPNQLASLKRIVVSLVVGVPASGAGPRLLTHPARIDCLIDTGANLSVFRGEVARQLGLAPTEPSLRRVSSGLGRAQTLHLCEYDLLVSLGDEPLPVKVSFPRVPTGAGASGVCGEDLWRIDVPNENILAIGDIVGRRNVCFTKEGLLICAPT